MREILMSLSQERKNPESRFTTYEKISFIVSKEIQLCHVPNPQFGVDKSYPQSFFGLRLTCQLVILAHSPLFIWSHSRGPIELDHPPLS